MRKPAAAQAVALSLAQPREGGVVGVAEAAGSSHCPELTAPGTLAQAKRRLRLTCGACLTHLRHLLRGSLVQTAFLKCGISPVPAA